KRNADNTYAYNVLVFYATGNGGMTWTPRPGLVERASVYLQSLFERQFDVTSSKDFFVRSGAHLWVTHDGAQSWRTIKPNIDFGVEGSKRDVSQLDFVDATHGWILIFEIHDDFME